MQLSTFATILGFVCAAIAAPHAPEGGDDYSKGGEHQEVERYCCSYNTYPPSASYDDYGSGEAIGCSKTNGACGPSFPVPWTCPVGTGSGDWQACTCTSSTECPNTPEPESVVDALLDTVTDTLPL
ncbi:hypothetical protein ABOM_008991 [Aspergillus bombycis]|uniref:Small secreted protein n=1 Tax=Aspergillus bombycis TaxID=109264 RepID=A0A1F7ZTP3_9EURO|nr:hypothetical protein ABOM_008991 [Aspergillus bombycis]OGM42820.1 hypothetical protein ABOM_008991 [Aspergillus bombycis]